MHIADPLDVRHALGLYRALVDPSCSPPSPCKEYPTYIIVNVVRWAATATSNSAASTSPASDWYLVHPASHRASHLVSPLIDGTLRIYGSRGVGFLSVHMGISVLAAIPEVRYTIESKGKKSVQETDAISLLNLVLGGVGKSATKKQGDYLVGAREVSNILKLPSNIIVSGGAYAPRAAATPDQKPAAIFNQTYDDEGFAFWDVSIGIPVKGVNEVQYSSDGTIQAKTVTRANAYGMAHWYPYPVDLKGDYPWQPSIVGGLALSGKPLNTPFVGLAIGTKKPLPLRVNVFAGIVFNKVFVPTTLATGSTATPAQLNSDLRSHRVQKLLVGIDIPITQFVSAITKKSQ